MADGSSACIRSATAPPIELPTSTTGRRSPTVASVRRTMCAIEARVIRSPHASDWPNASMSIA